VVDVEVDSDTDGATWRAFLRFKPTVELAVALDGADDVGITGAVGQGVVVVVVVTEARVLVMLLSN
jgi:hypothetical protein